MRILAATWLWLLGGCQLVFPLVEPDAPPPGDRDNDDVLDPDDNCPDIANADQHDEDRDGVGDVCDNCPHVENTSQDDNGDGDGLGVACDDSSLIDCIVRFDPFTSPLTVDPASRGNWVQVADSIHQNGMVDDGYLTVDAIPRANPLIIVGARVRELGAASDFSTHGVWFGSDVFATPGQPTNSILAELTNTLDLNVPTTAGLHVTNGGGQALLSPDVNMGPDAITQIALDLRGAGATVTGRLENGITGTRMLTATGVIGTRQIGLRAHQQEVAFDYLLVVERRLDACDPRD